jgi:glyoxylase-like metal-dependent hydrolase (beta-lactamase superfamily II)
MLPGIRRWFAAGLFAALLALSFFLTAGDAQPDTTKRIAPGVWFREGDLKHLGHCNNVIIEMADYLIVVDANFPSGARLAMEDARKLSPKPVKYVFITHHHGDHDYGSAVWTANGSTTLAYKGVAEEMKRYEPARWLAAAKSRQDVAELHRQAPELPKQTFDKSPFVLKDSTREVQFLFLGWAHTRGDGFAWLPKERVLCTGDAAANGPHNYTADGNIGNWPAVMDAALRLSPAYVLPGHGPAGGPEILQGQSRFMRELRAAVQQQVKKGAKLDALVTMKDGKPVATSIVLPAGVKNWVGDSLPAQVADAYNEATQGKPAGALPHS